MLAEAAREAALAEVQGDETLIKDEGNRELLARKAEHRAAEDAEARRAVHRVAMISQADRVFLCACGKTFQSSDELNGHIKEGGGFERSG